MDKQINIFDLRFADLHFRSVGIIDRVSEKELISNPSEKQANCIRPPSVYIIRSAAIVEQAFGGIATRLWDDPFEWTLPEELGTKMKIREYLEDVERARKKAFSVFKNDLDLLKEIPAPAKLTSIFEVILGALARAENLQGRAISALSDHMNLI